ncbi:hypothetical protein U1Q18_011600 [Sarracenia purpurea var. burkii]
MEVALDWPLGSLNPTDLALKVLARNRPARRYGHQISGEWAPREADLRRAKLQISGTAKGAIEMHEAGTCKTDGNASVFATKFLRFDDAASESDLTR